MQSQLPHIQHTLKRSIWNVPITFLTSCSKVTNKLLLLTWVCEPDTMCGSALYLLQSLQNYLTVSRTEKILVKWHKKDNILFLNILNVPRIILGFYEHLFPKLVLWLSALYLNLEGTSCYLVMTWTILSPFKSLIFVTCQVKVERMPDFLKLLWRQQ